MRNVLATAYDRATASQLESAWDTFISETASRGSFDEADLAWLAERAADTTSLAQRPAESLARVLGIVAERHVAARPFVSAALAQLFAHARSNVRVAALEAMLEVGVERANVLAARVTDDDHRSLREAADAVLRMHD